MNLDTLVNGTVWITSDTDYENYWCEGAFCKVEIERTDQDKIRIGIRLSPDGSDDVTLSLSVSEAQRMMTFLGAASVGVQVTA